MQNDTNVLASVAVVLKARAKAYLPLCFLQASPYFPYICVFTSVEFEGMGEDILVDVIPSGKSTFAPAQLRVRAHLSSCFPRLSHNGVIELS